jgi:hypothetical protein
MSGSKSVSIPSHLWEALDLMSAEMGVPSDALVAQAVFTLARLNGFVVPGTPQTTPAPRAASRPAAGKASVANIGRSAAPPPDDEHDEPEPSASLSDEPYAESSDYDDEGSDQLPADDEADDYSPPPAPAPAKGGGRASLTMFVAGQDPFKMVQDSFTIGRGKTCDFVIDSNRVSREHCRISREGNEFALEDLNSSNGTFFGPNKEKISRRKIKDGDEFTLGTEKIKFQIRR